MNSKIINVDSFNLCLITDSNRDIDELKKIILDAAQSVKLTLDKIKKIIFKENSVINFVTK